MSKHILELDNISFSYGNQIILDRCSSFVEQQSITAILGGNEQGKTTLMKCILKHNICNSGKIILQGKEINEYSVKDYAKIVSYVPQLNSIVNNCIVRDYIVEGRTPYLQGFSLPKKQDYLKGEFYAEKLGVEKFLGKHLSQLSGGEIQMIMIMRALVQETPIILMDEPLSALDMRNQYEVLKVIKNLEQEGKTVLFTTHNPNHAIVLKCMVWVLSNKTIAQSGTATDIITERLLQEIYNANVVLRVCDGWKCCSFTDIV